MKEKFAVVTGSTKGIGKAIGCLLLRNGFHVIFNYASDTEAAGLLQEELQSGYQGRFDMIHQKLETQEDVETFCKECRKIATHFDVLVLNAACTDRTAWKETTWKQWQRVMDVNLNAPAAIIRNFDADIIPGGNIVFIGAIMGMYTHAASISYSVSKAAVHGLAKALVKEYCEREIRVNAVLPGFVETPWQDNKPADQRERICKKISLHRFATAEEIAEIVWGVINMSYINGALIEADGGYCYA